MANDVSDEFTALYRSHYNAVRAYAAVCVSGSDVDDVVAETFAVAWRRFADIPVEWTRGWLIGVTRNVVRRKHRSERRAQRFVERLVEQNPAVSTGLDGDTLLREDVAVVSEALRSLKVDDQELLILSGPHEMSIAELAVVFDIKPNALKVRLHRARRRLRDAYTALLTEGVNSHE